MIAYRANDSTQMAALVYPDLIIHGMRESSRNGDVLKFPEPVTTTYTTPWQRANFTPGRDANPFFHIAEAMWMLAGRRDVEFLDYFNKGMKQYSDDGETFNAAYGYRARHEFGFDQLKAIPEVLMEKPDSRQAVIQLWHPSDLNLNTLDKACNMSLVFRIHGTRLDMTVFNRSNDLIFGGVTGANPVHMSYFQQWVADQLKLPMGHLTFVSNNAHIYLEIEHWDRMEFVVPDHYPRSIELPLGDLDEIEYLCELISYGQILDPDLFRSLHLAKIVAPIMNTWIARKEGHDYNQHLNDILCPAMMLACYNWIEARHGH